MVSCIMLASHMKQCVGLVYKHPALCTAYLECCGNSCCDNIFPQCVVESIIVTRGGQGRPSPPLPSAKKGQLLLLSLLPQSKVVHPRVQPALGPRRSAAYSLAGQHCGVFQVSAVRPPFTAQSTPCVPPRATLHWLRHHILEGQLNTISSLDHYTSLLKLSA